jgi:hypothetical protein
MWQGARETGCRATGQPHSDGLAERETGEITCAVKVDHHGRLR